MDETKMRALELTIQAFCAMPQQTIDDSIRGKEKEGKRIYISDLILEIAEKFEKYMIKGQP